MLVTHRVAFFSSRFISSSLHSAHTAAACDRSSARRAEGCLTHAAEPFRYRRYTVRRLHSTTSRRCVTKRYAPQSLQITTPDSTLLALPETGCTNIPADSRSSARGAAFYHPLRATAFHRIPVQVISHQWVGQYHPAALFQSVRCPKVKPACKG